MMDYKAFFADLRKRDSGVFGTSITQGQVDGTDAVLRECMAEGADLGQAAYILATAYGESAHTMQPAYEKLWYSAKRIPQVFSNARRQGKPAKSLAGNPKLLANTVYGGNWGRENLGNTQSGDGWLFRGTGIAQITGRANFTEWSKKLGLPLVTKPELLMQLDISVKALVRPMLEGWATGHKLPDYVAGPKRDYINARRVWNGTFDAAKYAKYARGFERALIKGGYAPKPAPAPTIKPQGVVAPKNDGGNIFTAILKALGWMK